MRSILCACLLFATAQVAAQPYAYIPNQDDGTVSVINTANNSVVSTITVGVAAPGTLRLLVPIAVAVSPDGSLVYVSNRASSNISVINTTSNTVSATIATGRVDGVAFSPDGLTAYATRYSANNVAVINVATSAVTGSIPVGAQPYGVVVTPDGTRLFVSNSGGNSISVIDTATNTIVNTITGVGSQPLQLAMSPNGRRVYAAGNYSNSVRGYDTTTLALVATIGVPSPPNGLAISPDSRGAYVTSENAARIWKLDLVAGTHIATLTAQSRTSGVNYHPNGQTVYVTNRYWNNVSAINVASNTITANIGVGRNPFAHGIFLAPGTAPVHAGVELDASPAAPLVYASEIIASPTAPATLSHPFDDLNLSAPLGYNFSTGEVRHARFECDSGLRFNMGSTALYDGSGSASIGAINGLGTGAIHFSVTANDSLVRAADRLVITGERNITSTQDVDCSYSLYDFPSQAASGGTAGRVATVSGSYLRFAQSHALAVNSEGKPVANVEADPAYGAFVVQPPTSSSVRGQIGGFSHGTRLAVTGEPQPLNAAGAPVTLANLLAPATALDFRGDFSAAEKVFLSSSAACAVNTIAAGDFDASGAVFTIGSSAQMSRFLCLEANGDPIPVSTYTAALKSVSANPAIYAVEDQGPLALGEVTRNGTQLQAPLVQIPANYQSRLVLTNTGLIPRTYSARILREAGSSGIPGQSVTGTIPPMSMVVVDMADVLGTITAGPPRGAVEVTIAGPNHQIQGLYQIINPNTGGISNHTMVRPGSN